jgi:hypothetical protein
MMRSLMMSLTNRRAIDVMADHWTKRFADNALGWRETWALPNTHRPVDQAMTTV